MGFKLKTQNTHCRLRDIAEALGVTAYSVRSLIKSGRLPKPLRLNAKVLIFDAQQVQAALDRIDEEARVGRDNP